MFPFIIETKWVGTRCLTINHQLFFHAVHFTNKLITIIYYTETYFSNILWKWKFEINEATAQCTYTKISNSNSLETLFLIFLLKMTKETIKKSSNDWYQFEFASVIFFRCVHFLDRKLFYNYMQKHSFDLHIIGLWVELKIEKRSLKPTNPWTMSQILHEREKIDWGKNTATVQACLFVDVKVRGDFIIISSVAHTRTTKYAPVTMFHAPQEPKGFTRLVYAASFVKKMPKNQWLHKISWNN